MSTLIWISVFLLSVMLHELSHGWTASRLGDPTAKEAGRLSWNPLKHIDPFWTVLFPALLFISTQGRFAIGMAKPVPVNFMRLRRPRRDMVLVAAAGPAANFLLALVLAAGWHGSGSLIFLYALYFNLGLALFNLVPIPPLDGSKILMGLLPLKLTLVAFKLERYGFLIIMGLYLSGLLFKFLFPLMNLFCRGLGVPEIHLGN